MRFSWSRSFSLCSFSLCSFIVLGCIAFLTQPAGSMPGSFDLFVNGQLKISEIAGGFGGHLDNDDRFGDGITNLGDLDGDGSVDIAVGSGFDDDGGSDHGALYVLFLNTSGTVKSSQKISATAGGFTGDLDTFDLFGSFPAAIGDLDGDGVVDIAAGARFDDDGGTDRGALYILFMNTDGTVRAHQKISQSTGGFSGALANGDRFGTHTVALGDLNGDGITELAVGASNDDDGGTDHGAVWILFMNSDGTVASQQKISAISGGFGGVLSSQSRFGSSVANLGDLDGDGIVDIAVGTPFDSDGAFRAGAVWIVFLNTNGTVKTQQKISNLAGNLDPVLLSQDSFGVVASAGDRDGDGVSDLYVGAGQRGGFSGSTFVLLLNNDGTVKQQQELTTGVGGFTGSLLPGDGFGSGAAVLGDINGDGIADFAVGANADDDGGHDSGAVWLLFNAAGADDMMAPAVVIDRVDAPADGFLNAQSFTTFPAQVGSEPVVIHGTATDDTQVLAVDVNGVEANLLPSDEWQTPSIGLTTNTANVFTATATDMAGNSAMTSVTVTHDVDLDNDGIVNRVDLAPSNPSVIFSDRFRDTLDMGSGALGIALVRADHSRAYVSNFLSGSVGIIDTDPFSLTFNDVVGRLRVGDFPYGVTALPSGDTVYVANSGSDDISVIDTVSESVVGTIAIGARPTNLRSDPSGAEIYVVTGAIEAITVINVATGSVSGTIALPTAPIDLAFLPTGDRALVSTLGNEVWLIDTATRTVVPGSNLRTGTKPYGVTISPDGTLGFVANSGSNTVSVIDLVSHTVSGAPVNVGRNPLHPAITPDGSLLLVPNRSTNNVSVVDVATATVVATIPVQMEPSYIALSPDNARAYVPNYNSNSSSSVSVLEIASGSVAQTIVSHPGGTTFGAIRLPHPQLNLKVTDAPNPRGVHLRVSGHPFATVLLNVCGRWHRTWARALGRYTLTCSSADLEVLEESADLEFDGFDGSLTSATIAAGNRLTVEFEPTDIALLQTPTFIAHTDNADVVTLHIDGNPILLAPGASESPANLGNEGCLARFWKLRRSRSHWQDYRPSDRFEEIFGVQIHSPRHAGRSRASVTTLRSALHSGRPRALLREATAALLNASNPNVSFEFDEGAVISMVQEAYATGTQHDTAVALNLENNEKCPLRRIR